MHLPVRMPRAAAAGQPAGLVVCLLEDNGLGGLLEVGADRETGVRGAVGRGRVGVVGLRGGVGVELAGEARGRGGLGCGGRGGGGELAHQADVCVGGLEETRREARAGRKGVSGDSAAGGQGRRNGETAAENAPWAPA